MYHFERPQKPLCPTLDRYTNSRSAQPLYQQRAKGFEPSTSSLGSWHSTTELRPQNDHFLRIALLNSPVLHYIAPAVRCPNGQIRQHGNTL